MLVTKEQYQKDLRKPLVELGYNTNYYSSDGYDYHPYIVNNARNKMGYTKAVTEAEKDRHGRYLVVGYNPELFLELAGLTTESKNTKEEIILRHEPIALAQNKEKSMNQMSNKRQSAVESIIEKIDNVKPTEFCSIETIKKWCNEAKEKERQQLDHAFINGKFVYTGSNETSQQYYEDNYE